MPSTGGGDDLGLLPRRRKDPAVECPRGESGLVRERVLAPEKACPEGDRAEDLYVVAGRDCCEDLPRGLVADRQGEPAVQIIGPGPHGAWVVRE